jgi:hypothetical protein
MNLEYYKLFQGIDQICKIENQPISFHSNSLSKLNTRIANKQVSASWFTSLYRNK